eukprot:CAMPEP_0177792362 /NCGR_PEP_ID=MMETSP0491_2-20121128/24484_1 /TAXON_ID=63592 /ORGANISM="Tetraselmis chuii, Strain PLY429" /LENGTH=124 /DNA_ID=CAMNT_0019314771 /DNA_START=71 /DNA_END=448 /DNA_ORIENTATION=-
MQPPNSRNTIRSFLPKGTSTNSTPAVEITSALNFSSFARLLFSFVSAESRFSRRVFPAPSIPSTNTFTSTILSSRTSRVTRGPDAQTPLPSSAAQQNNRCAAALQERRPEISSAVSGCRSFDEN